MDSEALYMLKKGTFQYIRDGHRDLEKRIEKMESCRISQIVLVQTEVIGICI